MLRFTRFSVLIPVLFFWLSLTADAGDYLSGALLRAEDDIKVYLVNDNIKRWVSSIEVFNSYNFSWKNVKVVPAKEVKAIKEGEPIVLETATPVPPVSVSPTPPVPAKINLKFSQPEYIRADWLISRTTSGYGRIGQRIVLRYSKDRKNKVENFRLYEKKPGDAYFYRIADFDNILSTECKDIDIDGEWMMFEAGQCEYWFIQRTVPPGGRGVTAYLPAEKYSEGEYSYYVAGVDKDGLETRPSPEAKLVFLTPISIHDPTDKQQVRIPPVFKWSIADNWPANSVPDYFISISDNDAAQSPLWGKQIRVSGGKPDESVTYDGLGLDPTKKYKLYIYGHYRKSDDEPDHISIPSIIPEFQVKTTSSKMSFWGLFKALFLEIFARK